MLLATYFFFKVNVKFYYNRVIRILEEFVYKQDDQNVSILSCALLFVTLTTLLYYQMEEIGNVIVCRVTLFSL